MKVFKNTNLIILSVMAAISFLALFTPVVSAATEKFSYSCSNSGQLLVLDGSTPNPYLVCWLDANNNGAVELIDNTAKPQVLDKQKDELSTATVSCGSGSVSTIDDSTKFSCSGGASPSVVISKANATSVAAFEADCKDANVNKDNCGIVAYLVDFINILSALVAIVVVIMVAVGGIQYAAAGSDPSAVVAARKRIINALIAFAMYIFMYAFLQWLIPGGLF
jgi:hypothetical protein